MADHPAAQRVIPSGYTLNNRDTQTLNETGATEQGISYPELRDYIHMNLNDDGFVRLKNSFHDNLYARDRDECKNMFDLFDILERQMVIDPKNKNYQKLIINLEKIGEKTIADYIRGQVDPVFAKQNNLVVSTEPVQPEPQPIRDLEDFRAAAELPEALHYETYHFCLLCDDRARDRALDYKDRLERELKGVKICTPDSFPAVGGIQRSRGMAVERSCYRILYLDEETWDSMCSKLTSENLFVTIIEEACFSVIPVVTTPELRKKVRKDFSSLAGLIKHSYVITDREHMNAMKSILKQAEIKRQRREENEQKMRHEAERVALRKRTAEEKRKTDEIDEQLATLAGLELTD
ncbi:uncharacterized protein LOC141914075 [Tubulanus polymorphus]|uniref:uncharacterized protein LOC141914075 n=1 Tax=Tubulanus polymorphus TaxID=672921 RepID=UPI003DA68677